MTYDKDLKNHRRICIGVWLMNCVAGALNVLSHHWLPAATSVVFMATTQWFIALIRAQQVFRDHVRIAQAGLRAIEERRQWR
jgi:hypothetical protein